MAPLLLLLYLEIMRIFLTLLFFANSLVASADTSASPFRLKSDCKSIKDQLRNKIVERICIDGNTCHLHCNRQRSSVEFESSQKKLVLHQIPKARDPAIVGTEKAIGFLPENLQVYMKQNVLAYLISMRTNSGGGGGQCGAGAETFLNFLDVSQLKPKVRGSILVGSCKESIELVDQNLSRGEFGGISIKDKEISLEFLFYKNSLENREGVVSSDFKTLIFK